MIYDKRLLLLLMMIMFNPFTVNGTADSFAADYTAYRFHRREGVKYGSLTHISVDTASLDFLWHTQWSEVSSALS